MAERPRVPALLGGLANGRPMDFPDPWPLRYLEDDPDGHTLVYTLWITDLPGVGLIEFFAPQDSASGMREGWLRSWLRDNPDWLIAAEFDAIECGYITGEPLAGDEFRRELFERMTPEQKAAIERYSAFSP
jgi:hypothetical protein